MTVLLLLLLSVTFNIIEARINKLFKVKNQSRGTSPDLVCELKLLHKSNFTVKQWSFTRDLNSIHPALLAKHLVCSLPGKRNDTQLQVRQ